MLPAPKLADPDADESHDLKTGEIFQRVALDLNATQQLRTVRNHWEYSLTSWDVLVKKALEPHQRRWDKRSKQQGITTNQRSTPYSGRVAAPQRQAQERALAGSVESGIFAVGVNGHRWRAGATCAIAAMRAPHESERATRARLSLDSVGHWKRSERSVKALEAPLWSEWSR